MPKLFKWGASISEYQNSGAFHCADSNWTRWEKSTHPNGISRIKNGDASGCSADFWNRYAHDIELMKQLKLNSFRFSIAWERIEPQEGIFDEEALKHYDQVIDALIAADIEPMITLHHFTHPGWFEDFGAFEHEENIAYFVRFAKKIFERFGHKVTLWNTINEPTIYMFQGYLPFNSVFPPGQKNFGLGLRVLRNLMHAHAEVYYTLKKMKHGKKAQIGLVHQYLKFKPYHWWNLPEYAPGLMLNYMMNDLVLNYCKTGNFRIPLPFTHYLAYSTGEQKPPMDFIGLNYYSRVLVTFNAQSKDLLQPTCYPHETMTDMPYAIYGKGLYEAIADVSCIGVPIYITENGIADHKDDRRATFINDYTENLFRAIEDGYDVRGYYYWSLTDNFEWDMGYSMKFGLCAVNLQTQERTIRDGAWQYARIIEMAQSATA